MKGVLLMLCVVAPAFAQPPLDGARPGRDGVVLLHGMGRSAISMKRLEWSLRERGYEVWNIDYPSTRQPVEVLAREHLAPALEAIRLQPEGRIHFVTHSLGGIVLRQYLAGHTPTNLGRVVMLGPPNQGSEVADRLKGNFFYQRSTGPSGQQVGISTDDLPRRLGAVDFPVGVIAGDRSWNPIFSALLPGPDDGKVSVARTRVEGMSDFMVLHASHTWLMWRQPVIEQALAFLETGRFLRSAAALN